MKKAMLESVYRISPDVVVEATLDGQLVILPVISGKSGPGGDPLTLNPVGQAVWKKIDGRTSLGEIIESLCRDYQGEKNEIENDVYQFVDELLQKNLLVPREIVRDP